MLQGTKILDLTTVVFGPYCTQILADLGADVLKVEPPEGDGFRYSSKPAKTRGMSAGHISLNRGKRSIVLDLKKQSDIAAMNKLVGAPDVFIHNVRLKAIEKLGLDFETVRRLNPGIVYIHCTEAYLGAICSSSFARAEPRSAISESATHKLLFRARTRPYRRAG
jgi:crotonobetainyl-CoA:carnitine CoA-transferase CaiB-like acyl-CoA transferase